MKSFCFHAYLYILYESDASFLFAAEPNCNVYVKLLVLLEFKCETWGVFEELMQMLIATMHMVLLGVLLENEE